MLVGLRSLVCVRMCLRYMLNIKHNYNNINTTYVHRTEL